MLFAEITPEKIMPWIECIGLVVLLVFIFAFGFKMVFFNAPQRSRRSTPASDTDNSETASRTKEPSRRFNFDFWDSRHEHVLDHLERHDNEIAKIQKDQADRQRRLDRRLERLLLGMVKIGAKVGADMPEEGDEAI